MIWPPIYIGRFASFLTIMTLQLMSNISADCSLSSVTLVHKSRTLGVVWTRNLVLRLFLESVIIRLLTRVGYCSTKLCRQQDSQEFLCVWTRQHGLFCFAVVTVLTGMTFGSWLACWNLLKTGWDLHVCHRDSSLAWTSVDVFPS